MSTPETNEKFLTLTELACRADWSRTTIERFLGRPDKTYTRRYRRVEVSLYSMRRIEAAERSKAFHENAVKLRARKQAAAKAAQTKLDRLLAQVAKMEVTVEIKPLEQVEALAIGAYNSFAGREYDGEVASKNSNRAFLDRIMVNHIRHELTQHDRQLWIVSGKSGAVSARLEIARRIFEAIAKAYPALQDECQRQLRRRMV